jgi:hypothetical protein
MSGNLYMKYDAADNGTQRPPTSAFWFSPAVVLATADGNYTVTNPPTPTTIDVQVSLKSPAAFEIINVEVWVCDPTTVAGPSTAMAPFQGATPQQLTLTGFHVPPNPSPISTVPVIQVTGFAPYSGISSLPGGHCCLIANCYGTTADGASDGGDLNAVAAANLPNLVQTDPHVAQRNIFADATPPGKQMKVINFPFRAATPLKAAAERVRLEIAETPPAQLRTILRQGLPPLKGGKFMGLPLRASERQVKYFGLTGLPKEGRAGELELEAHKLQVLAAIVELDPAEKPGAAHAFDIMQRDARGRAQGGFRLVTVARD